MKNGLFFGGCKFDTWFNLCVFLRLMPNIDGEGVVPSGLLSCCGPSAENTSVQTSGKPQNLTLNTPKESLRMLDSILESKHFLGGGFFQIFWGNFHP